MYYHDSAYQAASTFGAFAIIFLIIVWLILLGAVGSYAKRLGRDSASWGVFSFFFSPLLGAFALWLKGETDEHRKERIIEEEDWKVSRRNSVKEKEAEAVITEQESTPIVEIKEETKQVDEVSTFILVGFGILLVIAIVVIVILNIKK